MISHYINTDTMEYPRHPGDVALDPGANWEVVNETNLPEISKYEVVEEIFPINIDGKWYRQYSKRDMTTEEKVKADNPQPGPLHQWNSEDYTWYLPEEYLL